MATSRSQRPSGHGGAPQYIQDGTLALQRGPRPGPICRDDSPAAIEYAYGALYVKQAWDRSSRFAFGAIVRHAGADFGALLKGALPAMLMAVGAVAVTTGMFAAAGGAVGAVAGGVGAVPGAIIGADIGLTVATACLEFLGLALLVSYVKDACVAMGADVSRGIVTAWRSCGSQAQIDLAAQEMAEGIGRFGSLMLQAIVAEAAEEGVAMAAKRLSQSKIGAGIASFFKTEAFERALGKYFLERTSKPQGGRAPLGRLNESPLAHLRAGKAAMFYERNASAIRGAAPYLPDVYELLQVVDLSNELKAGRTVLKVGDEVVAYRAPDANPKDLSHVLFFTKRGESPTNLAAPLVGKKAFRYKVTSPPDVLETRVTGARFIKPGDQNFTGTFSEGNLSGGTGTQYMVPNASQYLEYVPQKPLTHTGPVPGKK